MTLKELIHNEDISGNQIHLYREGLFWKAYEHSAYRFVFGINPYKPLKKTIKATGQDVVSIGFPTTSLGKIVPLFSIVSHSDNHIVIYYCPIKTSLFFGYNLGAARQLPKPLLEVDSFFEAPLGAYFFVKKYK